MKAEKIPLTAAQRRARSDAKKRASGLVPVLVWVPEKFKPHILEMAHHYQSKITSTPQASGTPNVPLYPTNQV